MIVGILIRGHDLRIKQQTRISERLHLFEGKAAALHFRIVRGELVRPFLSTPLILRPVALGVKLQRVKIKGVAINGELYLIALRMVRMDAPAAGTLDQLLRKRRQV